MGIAENKLICSHLDGHPLYLDGKWDDGPDPLTPHLLFWGMDGTGERIFVDTKLDATLLTVNKTLVEWGKAHPLEIIPRGKAGEIAARLYMETGAVLLFTITGILILLYEGTISQVEICGTEYGLIKTCGLVYERFRQNQH